MSGLIYDLRDAFRRIRQHPGFFVVVVLTLGLGIGANTAIFSIVNGVLLRPLSYLEPERLVSIREVIPAMANTYPTLPVCARHFMEWHEQCRSFERLSLVDPTLLTLTGEGEPIQLDAVRVSANIFETMGTPLLLGRAFAPGEDKEGRNQVAILSHELWRQRFSADPGIIGKRIILGNTPLTVIGVLSTTFRFPGANVFEVGQSMSRQPQVFLPKVFSSDDINDLMGRFNYGVIGRLKKGTTRDQSLAELNLIAGHLVKLSGEKMELRAAIIPLLDTIVDKSRRALWVLMGAVGTVLLVVCVNLANLMLARAERREHESALRRALGASPLRVLQSALLESMLLAFLGGVLGLALASASLKTLMRYAPQDLPRLDEIGLDYRVLLFALLATSFTGILFGLAPALRSAHADPQNALRCGSRAAAGNRAGVRFRKILIGIETGLSALLLITAALFAISFIRLLQTDPGFKAPTVLTTSLSIPSAKYPDEERRIRFFEQLTARLNSTPGILSAATTTALPLQGETWVDSASVPGDTRPQFQRPNANVRFVSPGFFSTMGIPLLSGRTFLELDRHRKVAIISDRLAQTLWPGENPIGRQFARSDNERIEVVGLAGDVRADAHKPPVAMVYRPNWDWPSSRVMLAVRAAGDPRSIAGTIRTATHQMDAEIPIDKMQTMHEILMESTSQRQFQMYLITAFAATALFLAGLGIYGVMTFTVTRRTGELGIRLALGASPSQLLRMVIGQGLFPAGVGIVVGIACAVALGKIIGSMLYGVSPFNPMIMLCVSISLLTIAFLACYWPARRAARVDPLISLRYE
jgi:predicted permease